MSDDMNKKIKQITDLLGQEKLPDNLMGLLSLLASSGGKEEAPPKAPEPPVMKEERQERSELEDNMEMFRKVKKVMDKLGNPNDPRINLLFAIKPFLNNRRQKKLSNCINILRMSSLARFVEDQDKGIF